MIYKATDSFRYAIIPHQSLHRRLFSSSCLHWFLCVEKLQLFLCIWSDTLYCLITHMVALFCPWSVALIKISPFLLELCFCFLLPPQCTVACHSSLWGGKKTLETERQQTFLFSFLLRSLMVFCSSLEAWFWVATVIIPFPSFLCSAWVNTLNDTEKSLEFLLCKSSQSGWKRC